MYVCYYSTKHAVRGMPSCFFACNFDDADMSSKNQRTEAGQKHYPCPQVQHIYIWWEISMRDQNRKERKIAAHTNTCKSPSWRLMIAQLIILLRKDPGKILVHILVFLSFSKKHKSFVSHVLQSLKKEIGTLPKGIKVNKCPRHKIKSLWYVCHSPCYTLSQQF